MPCVRKGSGNTRLDSLCKYTAENLEFLDTPVHIHIATRGDHAQLQDCNDATHCRCTTNYGFAHVSFVRNVTHVKFSVAGLVNF